MPSIDDIYTGDYLTKNDFPQPMTCVISLCKPELVGQEKENRLVVYFQHDERGMVLNKGNANIIGALYGKDYTQWGSQQVVVEHDPTVQFQGKAVGGLRIRAPQVAPVTAPPAQPAVAEVQQ